MSPVPARHSSTLYDRAVQIPLGTTVLTGRLTVPADASKIVIFAHGSGSSRLSPRNWFVAEVLHRQHVATLVTDLLTETEEQADRHTGHLRFDIPLLAARLAGIADWVAKAPETARLGLCFFGASTGAAAALIAAAESVHDIGAVVSRGGRPDLAGDYLAQVRAPTLLIVGGRDPQVLALNEQALARLNDRSELKIVPGAGHLFEEPGTLDKAAHMAADWFRHHGGPGHALR